MSSSILINQLVVFGTRKNYTVNFNPGVNIIYGDSASGKTSILNLIDYLLGAKEFDMYPEIQETARFAALDVTLNDNRFSIKRDLFDKSKPIEVYPCSLDNIEQFAAKKYLPNFNTRSNYPDIGYFSDFLLDALNLTNLKIKVSPTKDDSDTARLSFRDIFKYCYVDQDDLGSKKFLAPDNYALQSKNIQVFKYIFNALDSQISELEGQISNKASLKKEVVRKFEAVSEFLRESEFGVMTKLDEQVNSIDSELTSLNSQLKEINSRSVADKEVYRAIKSTLAEIELDKKATLNQMVQNERKSERFTRLKNDYLSDIIKFKSSLEAREVIGSISDEIVLCPVCDNNLELESARGNFDIAPTDKVKHELNLLNRRVRETEQIINEAKRQWEFNKSALKEIESQEKKARELFEQNTKELTSPYLAERDVYVGQISELKQRRNDLISRLKIRNQHMLLTQTTKSLEISINDLNGRLKELQKNAPSMSDICSNLADNLKAYLDFVKIKDPSGIRITTEKFLPVVRGINYSKLTSGGLRTIVGIGYLCSLMEEALTTKMSYPSFLMIDTVGKYLGKTKAQTSYKNDTSTEDDSLEAVSDPQKYQNVFEHIIEIASKYEDKNRTCQFILVDNDVPDHIIDQLSGFIVAQYSSERINGLPVGFIDDVS